ncbi:hypothetical protein D3260_11130 [Salinisphaera sp. Q1T1-3]|nr:hypothetical protein D3260_11130 [Salinisphaera sp. Q1T1-3]
MIERITEVEGPIKQSRRQQSPERGPAIIDASGVTARHARQTIADGHQPLPARLGALNIEQRRRRQHTIQIGPITRPAAWRHQRIPSANVA